MTLVDIKRYLKIDDEDDDEYILQILEISEIYIDSMVGEGYKSDPKANKLAELLRRKVIVDMYQNRGTEIADNTKRDSITTSILDKLSNYSEGV